MANPTKILDVPAPPCCSVSGNIPTNEYCHHASLLVGLFVCSFVHYARARCDFSNSINLRLFIKLGADVLPTAIVQPWFNIAFSFTKFSNPTDIKLTRSNLGISHL